MSDYLPGPRRIVTTHNDQGLATVASDTVIELKVGLHWCPNSVIDNARGGLGRWRISGHEIR